MRTKFWDFDLGEDGCLAPAGSPVPIFDNKEKAVAFADMLAGGDARARRRLAAAVKPLKRRSLGHKDTMVVNPARIGSKVAGPTMTWREARSRCTRGVPQAFDPETGEHPRELRDGEVIILRSLDEDGGFSPIFIVDDDGERALLAYTSHEKAQSALASMAGPSRYGAITTACR
jgi:hypothetical protein